MMNKKGISPVIATVIIVAVAIAIAIAVAFWMTGIVGIFTGQVEQLQIVAIWQDANNPNNIIVKLKNTGTSPVAIDGVFTTPILNGDWNGNQCGGPLNQIVDNTCSIVSGGSETLTITLSTSAKAGQSIEIKIHTASGKEYPKLIVLQSDVTEEGG